jgi:hypothetical protein
MDALKKYGKKFAIGCLIGIGVWAGMSLLGLTAILPFAPPNPLTSTLYSALFFGVIQVSSSVINDLFAAKKPEAAVSHERETNTSPAISQAVAGVDTPSRPSHVARIAQQRDERLKINHAPEAHI